jgi:hypothetical protein
MTTVTITNIGSEEVTIPVSDTSDVIVQTLSDGPPLGSYIADHSLATNLGSDDHPQYLNVSRGDIRYASKSHEENASLHFTMGSIAIQKNQIIDFGSTFTAALETKLNSIEANAQVNNILPVDAANLTQGNNTTLHYHNADRLRSNHTGTQELDSIINDNIINTPNDNINLKDIIGSVLSAGVTSTGTIVPLADGYLELPYTEFFIRDNSNGEGVIYSASIGIDSISVQVLDGTTHYVYIDYNDGDPIWSSTLTPYDINVSSKIPVAIVSRSENLNFHVFNLNLDNVDSNAKLRKRLFYSEKFKKAYGGELLNPTGLQISVTSGDYWFGLSEYTHLGLVSGSPFSYYYVDNSVWYVNPTATELNGTQYNNPSTGLVNLTNKNYVNHWVYAVFNAALNQYAVVYGQAQYASLVDCISESPPVLPDHLTHLGHLIGVVTVYQQTGLPVSVRTNTGNGGHYSAIPNNVFPSTPPASATDIGKAGTITWDSSFIYVCVATNTWKRIGISTW